MQYKGPQVQNCYVFRSTINIFQDNAHFTDSLFDSYVNISKSTKWPQTQIKGPDMKSNLYI